jgi:SAM-dependent methyltransferase
MFDVLEHIFDQLSVLREIYRVVKPGGLLFVTVPRRHVFSFLDLGNLKFIFPRAHKFVYTRMYSLGDYDYRYVNNPYGLIGDIEKEKSWHQHFTEEELVRLLTEAGFRVDHIDGYGRFGFVMTFCATLGIDIFPGRLRRWDADTFEDSQFVCRFKKG